MKVGLHSVLISFGYAVTTISNVHCASGKGKEVAGSSSSSTASPPKEAPLAKGDLDYHRAKLHKHMTLREITYSAEKLQEPNDYVDMSKGPSAKKEFDQNHSLVPLINHFCRKSSKHLTTIHQLKNDDKLPGKKNLDYLKEKGKVGANYQPPE